jgi:hypothetical protein
MVDLAKTLVHNDIGKIEFARFIEKGRGSVQDTNTLRYGVVLSGIRVVDIAEIWIDVDDNRFGIERGREKELRLEIADERHVGCDECDLTIFCTTELLVFISMIDYCSTYGVTTDS